jgi:glycosyltransferase involved in cell wall biosynthesis
VRLIVYVETDILGGAEVVTGHLIEALRPDIEVVAMGPHRRVVEYLAGRRAGTEPIVVPPLRSKRELRAFPVHRRILRSLSPSIFQAVLTFQTACQWPLIAAGSVRGVTPIAVEHLPPLPDTRRGHAAKRRAIRVLAGHVAVGARVARAVEDELHLPRGSVDTIYNGVPDVAVTPAEIPREGVTIGVVAASLSPRKGVDVLLRAVAPLVDTSIVIVGDGPAQPALRELARSLGLDDRVHWVGWSDTPRPYIAAFDILAVPSREEAFPLVILEAMLAGRPVVASAVGSVDEAVIDGSTGRLVPPDDPRALSDALGVLVADPELRDRMGARGRERAVERFSVEAMARSYEAMYDGLAATDAA